ncbi:MAG TPA: glycerophosphodiester phosphodiesterase [Vicinamibacterales bacterium]
MLSRLLSLDHVNVIAHRGGSKVRPENTLVAFEHALTLGADAIECDVHLSRDGEPVVIHDPTLDRTTDARGPVSGLSAAELGRVDAGFQFKPAEGHPFRGRSGGVPRLSEVLDRFRMPFIVEIKGNRPEVADTVLGVIAEAKALDRVIVGGFSQAVLERVRRLNKDAITSASKLEARFALYRSYVRMVPTDPEYWVFQVPYRFRGRRRFRRAFVETVGRVNLPVQEWVVDDANDMRNLIDWGANGIITDRPDLAMTIVKLSGGSEQPRLMRF